jgi:hypothetical protein
MYLPTFFISHQTFIFISILLLLFSIKAYYLYKQILSFFVILCAQLSMINKKLLLLNIIAAFSFQ